MQNTELLPINGIKLPPVAGRIGRELNEGRWYESEMLGYIRSLGVHGNYVDIGANIGNHSVYFATNTVAERVFSFEPIKQPRHTLNRFIELNNLWTKITPIPYACSDHNGEVSVVESVDRAPTGNFQCRKLDDVINVPVALIKIDIEGAEVLALRGATKILSRDRPVMFIEIHDAQHMAEVLSVIGPIGYKPTGRVWNSSPTYEFVARPSDQPSSNLLKWVQRTYYRYLRGWVRSTN